MQSSTPMLSLRAHTVISAALAVLVVVTLSPLADVLVPALPVATGEVRWRFQVFGTVLAALPQLAFLLAAITAVGIFGGRRVAVRGAAIAALVLALVAGLLLVPFALDFLDMRRLVPVDRKNNFDMAAMKTGAFGGLFTLALAYLGWKGMQGSVKEKTTERKQGQGLVVGQE
ncbi:MAG: hypothetical protein SFU84_04660 [Gemmatimonadales bacterium]|nr:hypothetical protein [Gemmatimonadales bacterium]